MNYTDLKRRIGAVKASNDDVTSFCNLPCKGCLYFSGDDYKKLPIYVCAWQRLDFALLLTFIVN